MDAAVVATAQASLIGATALGADNQPKHRQAARDIRRQAAQRQPYERLLIVCEGEKTEPQYLQEIRSSRRLSTACVSIHPSGYGTDPLSIVTCAEDRFLKGDRHLKIEAKSFDRIVAVFDRDEHPQYHAALEKALARNNKLLNDLNVRVPFDVIASVPCFELWLLLHFENVSAPLGRREAYERLAVHLPLYEKGARDLWNATEPSFSDALQRARTLAATTNHYDGIQPFTAMHELVERLLTLQSN